MAAYQPPAIYDRDAWGASQPKSRGVPRPVDVLEGLVVHHQGATVQYDADPADLVRDIQWYHFTQGYSDIGYNTLVWHDGSVFLGRDAGVRGAHTVAPGTRDWNWTDLGVCLLGNGDDPDFVTDEAWRSIIWCWQVGMWVSGGRASGFRTHRETGSPTHCAGNAVQHRMDMLRAFLGGGGAG
jgi:N-acetylmuramoyl-L-alanine amidase